MQMAWSSLVIRSTVCWPNFSMQSLLEAAHQPDRRAVREKEQPPALCGFSHADHRRGGCTIFVKHLPPRDCFVSLTLSWLNTRPPLREGVTVTETGRKPPDHLPAVNRERQNNH